MKKKVKHEAIRHYWRDIFARPSVLVYLGLTKASDVMVYEDGRVSDLIRREIKGGGVALYDAITRRHVSAGEGIWLAQYDIREILTVWRGATWSAPRLGGTQPYRPQP